MGVQNGNGFTDENFWRILATVAGEYIGTVLALHSALAEAWYCDMHFHMKGASLTQHKSSFESHMSLLHIHFTCLFNCLPENYYICMSW